uniref:RNase H type-1 domain-containing protein n=1 Tax=Aegilops tauschii subsp. strangulata TaxID=200361 RepID=A0A453ADZ8_AEGTS
LAVPRPVPLQLGHHAATSPYLPMPRPHPAAGNTFHPPKRVVALVRWSRPPLGWCKLNFDGSVKHDGSGRASIGGVIRNSTGHAIVAYAERTEHAGVGVVEARALMRGLELALGMGCSSLVVEGDDLTLVRLLRRESRHTRIPSAMHDEIVRLLGCFRVWHVQHVYREGNQVADTLCHEAYRCPDVWTMDCPLPLAVWTKVECDRRGVVYERLRPA